MSIQFSDTSTYKGLIQFIERTLGFPRAYISGNADRLLDWTAELNLALDKAFHVLFSADGKWQFDDSNHAKNPFIYTELTINQPNYNFTSDEEIAGVSNLILDIHSVYARTSATNPYYLLTPFDIQTGGDSSFTDGLNITGWPTCYDKTGNLIKLDVLPKATVANGLKIFINREGSYFVTSDTTKKAGFAGLYHEYLILEACYRYARANDLKKREALKRDLLEMKNDLIEYQSRRARDETTTFTMEQFEYE